MSDHDRGAYAPHGAETPLRFDRHDARPSRGRRPLPMVLIGSGVVLLLLVSAVVMFYRSGSKGAADALRPVGGGIAQIKVAPSGGQPLEPGAGLEVYSPQNVPAGTASAAPQFTPAPEQPMARPAPPPPPVLVAKSAPTSSAAQAVATPIRPAAKPASAPFTSGANPAVRTAAAPSASPGKTAGPSGAGETRPAKASNASSSTTTKAPASSSTLIDSLASGDTTPAIVAQPTVAKAKPAPSTAIAEDSVGATSARADEDAGTITTSLSASGSKPKLSPAKAAKAPVDTLAHKSAATALPKGPLAPTKPSAASTSASAASALKGGYSVQVGAFPSAEAAEKGFSTASAKLGGGLGGRARGLETVQKEGKTLYRSTLKGFGSKTDAAAFCAKLRAKGGQCIVRGAGA